MGTPEFAVPGLQKLLQSNHTICGVVTTPDRPAGRGKRITPSPVKIEALKSDLAILQPESLQDSGFVRQLREWKPECIIVVAFRILPPLIFTIPVLGTINLHASYLPFYRGAAPINWVLINGENRTGLTTFMIAEKVDVGEILLQQEIIIDPDETAGELSARMALNGSDLVLETINRLEQGTVSTHPQPEGDYPRAPKLTKELCSINWNKSAFQVHNLVRGLSPVPGAVTLYKGNLIKILRTKIISERLEKNELPGTIVTANPKEGLVVHCGTGLLAIHVLMREGKRGLEVNAFLSGFPIEKGSKFN